MFAHNSCYRFISVFIAILFCTSCTTPPPVELNLEWTEMPRYGAYSEYSDLEFLVRTVNTLGKKPDYGYRLRGIANKFYEDWPSEIGLIGMQEVGSTIEVEFSSHGISNISSNCRVSPRHFSGAKCLADEMSSLFGINAYGKQTSGDTDVEPGIIIEDDWEVLDHDYWGIHSTFGTVGEGHRKLIMLHLRHRARGFELRFYSTHFTPGDDGGIPYIRKSSSDERAYQAQKVIDIVKEQARSGELPPIVVGDFNAERNLPDGAAEESVEIMERDFWRPIDIYKPASTGIDIIYIGRKESFPASMGNFLPIERRRVEFAHVPTTVDSRSFEQLTDHPSEGMRLRIDPGYSQEGIAGYVFSSQVEGTVPLYMLYNPKAGDHFYTIHSSDASSIDGWQPIGIAGYVFPSIAPNSQPFYRWYHPSPNKPIKTDHFYTTDSAQVPEYVSEGIECYLPLSGTPGTVPLYRYYNGALNDHFYTTDWREYIGLFDLGEEKHLLQHGDMITLETQGHVPGPKWLSRKTEGSTIGLVSNVSSENTGTKWQVIDEDNDGIVSLLNLENIDTPQWLDGRTADGTVGLAPSTEGMYTGTKWQIYYLERGEIALKCLGNIDGNRWLDGRTQDGTVGLAPNLGTTFTGAKWKIYKQ